MNAFEIDDRGRAAYHAAASVASNFLVTLKAAAERIAAGADLPPAQARELLAPLVRQTVENWAALGPERALTGPVARGDEEHRGRPARRHRGGRPRAPALFDLHGRAHPRAGEGARRDHRAHRGRAARRAERRAARVGLVPTMGALHEGHLSLVRRAREECDTVAVSVFVNPAQFGEGEDLEAYPRDEARDAALLEAEGADVLFAPAAGGGLPRGLFDLRARERHHRDPGGRQPRRRALRRRGNGGAEAAEHGPARRWRTSARRTPSRRW